MHLTFVDLETTGGSPVEDRITEVGIIEVDLDPNDLRKPLRAIREWSSLVNPKAPIPSFIEGLTGITNAMVANAPRFDEIAPHILERLEGRLFVAHNARFDHGFLKNGFRRLGQTFRPAVLCTVRLSRKLYPGYSRHNLDALVERHRLVPENRHRALGDARLLWQLWQKLHDAIPAAQIAEAIDKLTARPSLPRHLDPEVLDRIPRTAGVYLFYGDPGERSASSPTAERSPLYIGKAKNLRQRVMAHFTGDHLSAREMEISQQLRRLEWIETGGGTQQDSGALLLEATLVKQLQPSYNKRLRPNDETCAWRIVLHPTAGASRPTLVRHDDLFFCQDIDLYGPFAGRREASSTLRNVVTENNLCPLVLGLERNREGPCFSHQVKICKGACARKESVQEHSLRLLAAMAPYSMKAWPYDAAATFREGNTSHVVHNWRYKGMLDEHGQSTVRVNPPTFDIDVYKILIAKHHPNLRPFKQNTPKNDHRS